MLPLHTNQESLDTSLTELKLEDYQKSTTAVEAVFGTYELLETIFAQLSSRDIRTARTTSKTWFKTIERSKRIHDATFLMPINFKSKYAQYILGKAVGGTPTYKAGSDIELHSCLRQKGDTYIKGFVSTTFGISIFDGHNLAPKRASNYATEPPCQAIGIEVGSNKDGAIQCVVYVKDGVTVDHLLQVATNLTRQEEAMGKGSPVVLTGKVAELGGTEQRRAEVSEGRRVTRNVELPEPLPRPSYADVISGTTWRLL
ncbi:hypothetical protein LTR37_004365 [Vermiconidia calcicola]|uniref:Uncharacterized protein n=1 Tax=Vermiconidia calcicola TaxID=1690605 RepID=A0ACC3NNP4_9PEZI|nr:hypothetical protein LTR37_004365 [Vermiconidia calcicola]